MKHDPKNAMRSRRSAVVSLRNICEMIRKSIAGRATLKANFDSPSPADLGKCPQRESANPSAMRRKSGKLFEN